MGLGRARFTARGDPRREGVREADGASRTRRARSSVAGAACRQRRTMEPGPRVPVARRARGPRARAGLASSSRTLLRPSCSARGEARSNPPVPLQRPVRGAGSSPSIRRGRDAGLARRGGVVPRASLGRACSTQHAARSTQHAARSARHAALAARQRGVERVDAARETHMLVAASRCRVAGVASAQARRGSRSAQGCCAAGVAQGAHAARSTQHAARSARRAGAARRRDRACRRRARDTCSSPIRDAGSQASIRRRRDAGLARRGGVVPRASLGRRSPSARGRRPSVRGRRAPPSSVQRVRASGRSGCRARNLHRRARLRALGSRAIPRPRSGPRASRSRAARQLPDRNQPAPAPPRRQEPRSRSRKPRRRSAELRPSVEARRGRARIELLRHDRAVPTRIAEDVDEHVAHVARSHELARVIAVREQRPRTTEEAVHPASDPHEEPFHAARKSLLVLRLAHEVHVVRRGAVVHDAQTEAFRAVSKRRTKDVLHAARAQALHAVDDAHGDVQRMPPGESRPRAMRDLRSRRESPAPGTGSRAAARLELERSLMLIALDRHSG